MNNERGCEERAAPPRGVIFQRHIGTSKCIGIFRLQVGHACVVVEVVNANIVETGVGE